MNIKRDFKINRKEISGAAAVTVASIKIPFGQTFKIDAYVRGSVDDGASAYQSYYAQYQAVVRNGLGGVTNGASLDVIKPGTGYSENTLGSQATTAVSPSRGSNLTLVTTVDSNGGILTAVEGLAGGSLYAPGDTLTLDGGTAQVLLKEADLDSLETLTLQSGEDNARWGTDGNIGFSFALDQATSKVNITVNPNSQDMVVEGGYCVTYMANTPV
jgi:hypothetical protein